MADFLERDLRTDEIVHHVNGDKTDNRIENLVLLTHSEHSLAHRGLEKIALSLMESGQVRFNYETNEYELAGE